MLRKKIILSGVTLHIMATFLWTASIYAEEETHTGVYPIGKLKPRDSVAVLKVGDKAPDFTLPALDGSKVSLTEYIGKKNIVISFIPAAWTPVCTYQWPSYDLADDIFHDNDAILLGISVDNIPTLYAWTKEIAVNKDKLWFPVLSDFFPQGKVAKKYGVLRSEGFSERALFVIDKKGIIQFIDVHNINERPPLQELRKALEDINK